MNLLTVIVAIRAIDLNISISLNEFFFKFVPKFLKLEFVSVSSPRQYSRHKTSLFLLGN